MVTTQWVELSGQTCHPLRSSLVAGIRSDCQLVSLLLGDGVHCLPVGPCLSPSACAAQNGGTAPAADRPSPGRVLQPAPSIYSRSSRVGRKRRVAQCLLSSNSPPHLLAQRGLSIQRDGRTTVAPYRSAGHNSS